MTDEAVSAYLNTFSGEALDRINTVRKIVSEEAPRAEEGIAYGLIGWKLNGRPLIYVGGFAKHTGLYATPQGHEQFTAEFSRYRQGKGSVQFPLNEDFPVALIRDVVRFRASRVGNELPGIGRPATSALEQEGITTMGDLNGWTAEDLLKLHGVGPKAIRILREAGAEI